MAPALLKEAQKRSLLFVDQATCHKTAIIKNTAKHHGISLSFIPSRMTGLLQPPDVSWLAVMKRAYRSKWNKWYAKATKFYTKFGNMRSQGYATVIRWLSEIWESLSTELISDSFDQ